jgi:hypothetical protein
MHVGWDWDQQLCSWSSNVDWWEWKSFLCQEEVHWGNFLMNYSPRKREGGAGRVEAVCLLCKYKEKLLQCDWCDVCQPRATWATGHPTFIVNSKPCFHRSCAYCQIRTLYEVGSGWFPWDSCGTVIDWSTCTLCTTVLQFIAGIHTAEFRWCSILASITIMVCSKHCPLSVLWVSCVCTYEDTRGWHTLAVL